MKHHRRLFYLLLLIIWSNAVVAQGWVSGTVRDHQNQTKIPGVLVLIHQNQGVTTNESGSFTIWSEKPQCTLTFRYLGFKTTQKTFAVVPKDTLHIEVELTPEVFEMDQVVVTANRIEQRLSELTVSMSVIKPKIIENQHMVDAKALISRTPGIDILDGQASIRGGSGFSYGAGSRVLALIDGLPVIAPDAGNIRWQFLPLDNVSQIEIIKGASSVAYGSSALNGVINFRTADATSDPITKVYLQAGVYDRPPNKNWKWWSSPRLNAAAGFSHLQKKGHSDFGFGINGLTDNGYRKYNDEKASRFHFKWKYTHPRLSGLRYGISMNGGLTRKTDFVLWDNAETGALIQDTATAISMDGSFIAFDPFISWNRKSGVRHDLRSRLQQSINSFPTSEQNNSTARSFYVGYEVNIPLFSWLKAQTGLSQQSAQIVSNFHGNHNSLNAGAFLQLESQPVENLQLVGGLRVEYNAIDGYNESIVPLFRAGLNYRIATLTFLRASFGQGFRYPSIAERHASTTLGAVKIFPNLFIEPESGWNAEAGLRQGFKSGKLTGQLDVALFYMQNKDMIEYLFGIYANPGDETFSFGFKATNIEAARIYGVETEGMLAIQSGNLRHQLSGGYTYIIPVEYNVYTGENTELYLKYRRKHSAKLNWEAEYRRFQPGISINWQSKMLRIDDVFLNELTREGMLPGFYDYWQTGNNAVFVADVWVSYKLTLAMRLSFMIKNVTNEEYLGRPGDIQPQRNYSLRLSWGI